MDPEPLSIHLFGPLTVMVRGRPMAPLRTRKSEWLLALLASRAGTPVDRTWLAGTLWPESDDAQGRYNLRRSLSEVRRALGDVAEAIVAPSGQTLFLDPAQVSVDRVRFDQALERGDPAAAIALVSGPYLEGCVEDWAVAERLSIEARVADARRRLADAARDAGDRHAEIRHRRALLRIDPLDEASLRDLMEALAAIGSSAAARDAYHAFRKRVAERVRGSASPDTVALFERIERDADRPASPEPPKLPIAPPRSGTALIGRDAMLGELTERWASRRLVTLVGPGGIGKTRLATAWAERFERECCFVDLAPVARTDALVEAVASALRVSPTAGVPLEDAIVRRLRDTPVLLLCDNAEHLHEGVATLVADLLARCPEQRVLVTSRIALGLETESVFPVPPLSLCDPESRSPVEILAISDAVRLFVDRAQMSVPSFRLTAANAAAVARICARLDGIPLAIELAASRVRTISCEAMERRLGDEMALFTQGGPDRGARHRTLEATIRWSFDLLSEAERQLISELSFLVGTFTLEAAEAVHGTRDGVVQGVIHLVDHSLLAFDDRDGAGRYRMLETVRHFARARIDTDAARLCRERHSRYFRQVAEDLGQALDGIGNPEVLRPLEQDLENLREVLRYGDPESRLRLCASIWPVWFTRGEIAEGRRWLDQALSAPMPASGARATALYAAGSLAIFEGDQIAARTRLQEALGAEETLGNLFGQVRVLNSLGVLAIETGAFAEAREALLASRERVLRDPARRGLAQVLTNLAGVELALANLAAAEDLLLQAIPLLEASRAEGSLALALSNLGEVAFHAGRLEQAREHFLRAEEISERIGFAYGAATVDANLGRCLLGQGELGTARERLRRALRRWFEQRHPAGVAHTIGWLAEAAFRIGDAGCAAELLGASERWREEHPVAVTILERRLLDAVEAAVRAALGDTVFASCRRKGASLDGEAILERVQALETPTGR